MIWDQYQQVKEQLNMALQRAGRPAGSARLIAVSKTKPLEMVEELASHGVLDFGENKVQELCAKQEVCRFPELEWHFIGHLQRNKVRQLLQQKVALIHSLDSDRLAREIQKEAERLDRNVPVLVEINIGKEASKSGIMPEEAEAFVLQTAAECPRLKIRGLMCVAPAAENGEEVRPYFRQMREIRDQIQKRALPGVSMKELSMGMTGDFPIAVEEGATMIRVGTAIFGERNYNIE